jgi:hypothetical protein
MRFLSSLLGTKEPAEFHAHEQAVLVHFFYGSSNLQLVYALEDQLRRTISESAVGEYDSKKVADDGSDGYFYMYGPNAEALYRVVSPIITAASFMKGATVTLRFGPANRATPKRVFRLPA